MYPTHLLILGALLVLTVTACGPDVRAVLIQKADNTLVLASDTLTINVQQNSSVNPFILKSVPTNPPAGVSISGYRWTIKLDGRGAGAPCANGSAEAEISAQPNLAWVINPTPAGTPYGGCYVQGSMTGRVSVYVSYSDNKVASGSVGVSFFVPPN